MPVSYKNAIVAAQRALSAYADDNVEYEHIYENCSDAELRILLATIHHELIKLFTMMNSRLPTGDHSAHYWAAESRELLSVIDIINGLEAGLRGSSNAFCLCGYYRKRINELRPCLKISGGSEIPPHTDAIELYYTEPIFILANTACVAAPNNERISYQLKSLGEGSYARTYKYRDKFYNLDIVIKRAKDDLSEKELVRFEREYETLKSLSSPYVMSVYRYNHETKEYFMEYMDYTLEDFICKHNNTISTNIRLSISRQIIRAFQYVHSKGIMHRDISPKNILLKQYDDAFVVKLSDFGLVKLPESQLTSDGTEFKGAYNDPELRRIGFSNYTMRHEIYAITLVLYYVMTGRHRIDNIRDSRIKEFVERGTNSDTTCRYPTIEELSLAFERAFA